MRSTLALAAALATSLAAAPALASSATFYDFTIEITDRTFANDDPLFDGKDVGDTFNGELSVTFPVEDEASPELDTGQFSLGTLTIDGFASSFFDDPGVFLTSGTTQINAGSSPTTVFFETFDGLRPLGLDDNDDDLTADDLLALLLGTDFGLFFASTNTLDFKVTAASIRPDHDPAVIPLPAAAWMLIAGLGGLAALRRVKA